MTKANCFSCKKEVDIKDEEISLTKRGVRIAKGKCSICGKGVARILPKA